MYKHLIQEQRYTIDALLQNGKSVEEIASIIGVHKSTVYREIKRNSGVHHYHCKLAQRKSDDRKRHLQSYRMLSTDLRSYIRKRMKEDQLSPERIKGELERQGKFCVCVETIYSYIRADKKNGGELWTHCRHALKHTKRQAAGRYIGVQNRTMIDERPSECDGSTPGDFEIDTIVGANGKDAILTIVERHTNMFMARKLPKGKNAKALADVLILAMLPYIGNIRSITTDNGSEFADHLRIAKRLKTKVYFCHPYSSWEKGFIEYHNKLLRQYIPKGTDFKTINDDMLKSFVTKINKRPRKKLSFSFPVREFFNFIA